MTNTATLSLRDVLGEIDGLVAEKDRKAPSSRKSDKQILAALEALGGQRVQDDALIFAGDKIVLPSQYEGNVRRAIRFLEKWDEEQNQTFRIDRKFNYHYYDVANAFQRTLKKVYGTTGFGGTIHTMFGPIPPSFRTVHVSATETIQVPWDKVELPILEAEFYIGAANAKHGNVGVIGVELPKRNRAAVEGLYKAIEADLREFSLFRGKAIDANWHEPEFLDLSGIDRNRVVYSADTEAQINANVWAVVEHAEEIKRNGMQLKRAVLLEGPYGTGKSLTGYLTAQKAVANGWTFIYCRPGQDLRLAFHAAKLYAPSVVFFEDLDVIADAGDTSESNRVSQLLDLFDGVSNKTTPIVAVLTTNHVERLHRGMLRPGRLDAVIHIGELDAGAIEKLVRATIPEGRLAGNVDWQPVTDAMAGFLPAFIKEASERALRYAIARGDASAISTEDLVNSATGLRPQLDLMTGANEAKEPDTLGNLIEEKVRSAVTGTTIADISNPTERYYVLEAAQD